MHGDPAADVPAVLLALDATLVLRGPGGDREVVAQDFFVDFWETAVQPDEILVEIRVPALPQRPWGFVKFRQRSQDWATVGVAVQERNDRRPAVALVNMGPTPLRARAVEEALAGEARWRRRRRRRQRAPLRLRTCGPTRSTACIWPGS